MVCQRDSTSVPSCRDLAMGMGSLYGQHTFCDHRHTAVIRNWLSVGNYCDQWEIIPALFPLRLTSTYTAALLRTPLCTNLGRY
jgi:hypothetical protein